LWFVVCGLWFVVWGSGFVFEGLGFRTERFWFSGLRLRVEGSGCWVVAQTPFLFNTMHLLISFRKPAPPQIRPLNTSIRNSQQEVDDFMGELTL